jgi:hypothetical protein
MAGVVCLAAASCGASSEGKTAPDALDAGGTVDAGAAETGPPVTGDDGGNDAVDVAATAPQTFVRVAHAVPDAPPVDFCVAPHGTTAFQGPLLGQLAGELAEAGAPVPAGDGPDGAADFGLSYTQVSAYVALDAGTYDLRIVASGAGSCDFSAPPSGDAGLDADGSGDGPPDAPGSPAVSSTWTSLAALPEGGYTTILLAGDLSPAGSDALMAVTALRDDAILPGGAALLRAVNAVPSAPDLDFGLGSSPPWIPLVTAVAFGQAAGHAAPGEGAVDANGYLPVGAFASQPFSVRATGRDASTDLAASAAVSLDLGAVATVFAIGGKTGDVARPSALLLCIDNQPAGGLLSDCSVLP